MSREHTRIVVFEGVYPPSEDSYLLLDSLELQEEDEVLEIGCGSGVITVDCLEQARRVVSVDLSAAAVRNTAENIKRNGLEQVGAVVQANLLAAISEAVRFSVIVFNPPYLARDENATDMDAALVGGERGNEVILQFVEEAVHHLVHGGSIYLVMSSLSRPDEVQRFMESLGLIVDIRATLPQFFERLIVIRGTLSHKETVL
jgi:release factor glutamine methyltransferase